MSAVDAVIDAVAAAVPEIRGGLPGRRRSADAENPSGELQMAADVYADELLEERLSALAGVGAYASEERETVVDAGEGYTVAVDPLDGSSNLKSNNAMGTVLAVYDAKVPATGRDLVAAAYVLYGPITTMVVARDGRVTDAVIEDDGSRRIGDEDVQLPADPTV
jgi:fructose-1,6-bisphosphatase I